jgi:ABC-type lipoprotein export system ATPase subunit
MIVLRELTKLYTRQGEEVVGLDNVSLTLKRGDFACLRGPSGSGKTTLLLTIGGMQRPTRGTVDVAGHADLYAKSSAERARVRARHVGFVFQMFHLVPYLDVVDNIRLGIADGKGSVPGDPEVLIERLGLTARRGHRPDELSVGECQRVAVARALISKPDIILADEPTGNLDAHNAQIVIGVLQEFCQAGGILLLATHSELPMALANRRFSIAAGNVTGES